MQCYEEGCQTKACCRAKHDTVRGSERCGTGGVTPYLAGSWTMHLFEHVAEDLLTRLGCHFDRQVLFRCGMIY